MNKREFMAKSVVTLGAAAVLLTGCTTTPLSSTAKGPAKEKEIDDNVNAALDRLYSTVPGSHDLVNKAQGVLVFPSVLAVGFVVGGQYGEGALRVNGKTVDYYSTITGSFGLQVGAQSKAIFFLFMTKEALDKFVNSKGWTAGVDASVALIKVGANGVLDLNTATKPVSAIVMTNQGLMANLNVEGTKVSKLKR
ncbi:YSC84-related protein [Pollutimonas bauzanensis]|uniref:BPSL1445 family SYLF domain-containing lipoprotein n=1 Tax=Pollutimonas bauzanensis TaxID=658167 RepID=UPI003341B534